MAHIRRHDGRALGAPEEIVVRDDVYGMPDDQLRRWWMPRTPWTSTARFAVGRVRAADRGPVMTAEIVSFPAAGAAAAQGIAALTDAPTCYATAAGRGPE